MNWSALGLTVAAVAGVAGLAGCGSNSAAVAEGSQPPPRAIATASCLEAEGVCVPIADPASYVAQLDSGAAGGGDRFTVLPLQADGQVLVPAEVPGETTIRLQCAQPQGGGSCDPNVGFGSVGYVDMDRVLHWLKIEY